MSDPFANHPDHFDAAENSSEPQASALDLPASLQQVLRWITRQQQTTLRELAQHLEQEEAAIHPLLTTLVEQGLVQVVEIDGASHYRPKLASRKGRRVSSQIWEKLEE